MNRPTLLILIAIAGIVPTITGFLTDLWIAFIVAMVMVISTILIISLKSSGVKQYA